MESTGWTEQRRDVALIGVEDGVEPARDQPGPGHAGDSRRRSALRPPPSRRRACATAPATNPSSSVATAASEASGLGTRAWTTRSSAGHLRRRARKASRNSRRRRARCGAEPAPRATARPIRLQAGTCTAPSGLASMSRTATVKLAPRRRTPRRRIRSNSRREPSRSTRRNRPSGTTGSGAATWVATLSPLTSLAS